MCCVAPSLLRWGGPSDQISDAGKLLAQEGEGRSRRSRANESIGYRHISRQLDIPTERGFRPNRFPGVVNLVASLIGSESPSFVSPCRCGRWAHNGDLLDRRCSLIGPQGGATCRK